MTEPPSPAPANGPKNGVSALFLTLAKSGDRIVQLGTLALVALSGLGSFFQTEHLSHQSQKDRDKAVREIHLLYDRVDEFERRQRQALNNQQDLIDSNTKQLENQLTILRLLRQNQDKFLEKFPPNP